MQLLIAQQALFPHSMQDKKLYEEEEVNGVVPVLIRNAVKKGIPFRAPRVGSHSDLIPGIVFKLYPTIISKNVSDYLLCNEGLSGEGECDENSWSQYHGVGARMPFQNGSIVDSASFVLKRRHSRAYLGSKSRKKNDYDKWEDINRNTMRRHSIQCEQLVPRTSPSMSKENSSDSEIDVTSLSIQSDENAASPHQKSSSTLKRKLSACGSKKQGTRRPSHIICNKLLMTTSRRISATGTVDGRFCASCEASITPYWRDGWSDELMLCNACGLRFQKFMKRCNSCSYIPRKEDNELPRCPHCDDVWV